MLDFNRILAILNPAHFADFLVLGVGCGSGNSTVIAELAKCGVSQFALWDQDTLGPENLVRHVLGRADLGRNKAEAMRDWVLDRNPSANVVAYPSKFQDSAAFEGALADTGYPRKLILCGVDDQGARLELGQVAVRTATPMVLGMVYRGGVGGMSFVYRPKRGACFSCLNTFALSKGMVFSTADQERSTHSEEEIYGLSLPRFVKSPGLSISVGLIGMIMARLALGVLLDGAETTLRPIESNLVVFACQPDPLVGRKHFDATHFMVSQQRNCIVCSTD